MHNDLNERRKAKKRLALNSRDIHVGWIVGTGVSMLIFLLATFATAYRHDAYSSRLGLRDLMTTDVWFRVFLALTCFSLLLFLGLLVYAFVAGRIDRSGDNEGQEALPMAKTPEIKDVTEVAIKDESPVVTRPASSAINEDKLRKLLDTPFMRKQSNGSSKTNLDRFIDDVKTVRIQHQKGAKDGINDKSITSIAKILYSNKHQKQRPLPSFAEWNTTLFECLNLEAPQKGNINKSKDLDEQITKLFGYLIPSE
jgi:hypothetical protein